jgi:glycerophosphoryl diester phosphodiesterase
MSSKITFAYLWFASALIAVAEPLTHADLLRDEFLGTDPKTVLVAAHRGDWRGFPENSLPAIESAIRIGADIVEVDVGRTKDGEFVLMHDTTLDRTTTGTGKVSDHTLSEIRTYSLRSGYGGVTIYRVPTLEEAMLAVKGRVLINLDKSYGWLREFLPILERTGTARQAIIKTYNLPAELVLKENGDILGHVLYMPITIFTLPGAEGIARGQLAQVKPAAMEIIFPEWRSDVESAFASCSEHHTRIWCDVLWPGMCGNHCDDLALTDPENNYGWLLKNGCTVIQTDRPEYLLSYLRRVGRHS